MSRRSFWHTYGFPLTAIGACIVTAAALRGRPGSSTTDFLAFYQSGRQFLEGTDPYFPFVPLRGANLNPPWAVLLMAQLSRAPLEIAVGLWWACGFACLLVTAVLVAKAVAPGHAGAMLSVVLLTQAAYSNIRLGQVAWPVMLLLTIAWYADRSHRDVLCGALLGLVISWKPFLLVFVPYLVWRRAWRSLAALAAAIGATIVVGLAAVGSSGFMSWLAALRQVTWVPHLLNASVAGFVTRADPLVPESSRVFVWMGVSAVLAGLTAWKIATSRDVDMAWASLPLLGLLLSPLGWIHYLPIAVGPMAALVRVAPATARSVGIVGWLLICNPLAWMVPTNESGLAMKLTLGSSYMWGAVLVLAALFTDSLRSAAPFRTPQEPAYRSESHSSARSLLRSTA